MHFFKQLLLNLPWKSTLIFSPQQYQLELQNTQLICLAPQLKNIQYTPSETFRSRTSSWLQPVSRIGNRRYSNKWQCQLPPINGLHKDGQQDYACTFSHSYDYSATCFTEDTLFLNYTYHYFSRDKFPAILLFTEEGTSANTSVFDTYQVNFNKRIRNPKAIKSPFP